MLVDWFTVGAQALNFLILVWLMKRFLYGPILHAIDEREKRIAGQLADADAKEADALTERNVFRQKNEEFEQQRAGLLKDAKEEASAERQHLIDQANEAAKILSAKRKESLRSDAHNLNQAIAQRTQQEVFAIARKTLADLAGASLEERIGEVFIQRLRAMDKPAKQRLAKAVRTAPGPALVRSAFDLPAVQRETISQALRETLSVDVTVRFETAPEVVGGIEVSANGQKVAWSIAEYLRALEVGVGEILNQEDRPEVKRETAEASELLQARRADAERGARVSVETTGP